MNGELALSVVLVTYGNVYLAGGEDTAPPALIGTHPACTFVRAIEFVDQEGNVRASDPAQWFALLRAAGARRLWLRPLPPTGDLPAHVAEAFSGGVARGIEVECEDRAELWVGAWRFGPGQRWSVRYGAIPLSAPTRLEVISLERIERCLARDVEQARVFAERAALSHWSSIFAQALELLRHSSETIPSAYLPETGFPPRARRLIEAADRAWVFGGMGSWNDLWFPQRDLQQEYEVITAALYDAVVRAIVGAANSFGLEPG